MPGLRENTVVVRGYTELVRAFDRANTELETGLRGELKRVGEVVRVDAASRFQHFNARSAQGFRTYVTRHAVNVSQSIKRVNGRHPEYGALQMTQALLPALDSKQSQVMDGFESLLDKVVIQNFGI